MTSGSALKAPFPYFGGSYVPRLSCGVLSATRVDMWSLSPGWRLF